jgi:hypothetical protein
MLRGGLPMMEELQAVVAWLASVRSGVRSVAVVARLLVGYILLRRRLRPGEKRPMKTSLFSVSASLSFCIAAAAGAQDIAGRWYGVIEGYNPSDKARRILEIEMRSGEASCMWSEVGVSVRSLPCSIENGGVSLVTVAKNPVRLVREGAVLRGTITFANRNATHLITMGRDPNVVLPTTRETSHSSQQKRTLGPRDFEAIPEPGQIPSPNVSAAQIQTDCLRYFNNVSYSGSITAEKQSDKTQTQFWPGVLFAKFTTTGSVAANNYFKRPVCRVTYSWSSRFASGKNDLPAHFDGRWLMGKDFLMEASGQSLLFTAYLGEGRRSWGTYQRD